MNSSKAYNRQIEADINKLYHEIDTNHEAGGSHRVAGKRNDHHKVRKFKCSAFPHQWIPTNNR